MNEKELDKTEQEIVDVAPSSSASISPQKIHIVKRDIQEIDIYSDDIGEDEQKSKKKRLEESYYAMASANWYESVEDWYVTKKRELTIKEKLTKQDEILLKILDSVAKDMWYNESNREFVIWTNVKKIWNKNMLAR